VWFTQVNKKLPVIKLTTVGDSEVIGMDVGGTAIKLGRFLADGTCLESLSLATPQPALPEAVLDVMVVGISKLVLNAKQIVAIGVGTPGPADREGRIARVAINLPGWHDVPLADWLEAGTGISTVVANDANCAGLGEVWLGVGSQFRNLIMLTLGTGIGGAIFLDGQLFTGDRSAAGELGLITFNPEGPSCHSGNQGSLEQYISAVAIERMTGKAPAELGKLAQAGDRSALAFWERYGRYLGTGLASLIYVLTPEAVVIGGGISASAEFFLPAALAEIERRVMAVSREGLQLLPAKLGNQAGMVGAAKLAWQKFG
jgi:glucokinase